MKLYLWRSGKSFVLWRSEKGVKSLAAFGERVAIYPWCGGAIDD